MNRQHELLRHPLPTASNAFPPHIGGLPRYTNMDNQKDDVFSRPPVPGLNGLPRERKQRFSGGSPSALLRIKVEPNATAYNTTAPLIPPNCIKSEALSFKRFESYPQPSSPLSLVTAPASMGQLGQSHLASPGFASQYHHNMRRYSLPEYKQEQSQEQDILVPLNLTRRSSSSEVSPPPGPPSSSDQSGYYSYQRAASLHHHHPDVKRELPDVDLDQYNQLLIGSLAAGAHDDHSPSRRHSLTSHRGTIAEDQRVEAVYRDYGRHKREHYENGSPGQVEDAPSVGEVYRGEFESSRSSSASNLSSLEGLASAKKEPADSDGKPTENASRGSARTIIEFDGNDCVLCRVCGDKASGFHYGVHSCEGCKGFFRRSIQQKIQYRPCNKNQQCSILRINRNRCQYCRLKKCISAGMSRDAVRFGRVPKREKAKILAAMQSSKAKVLESRVLTEMADDRKIIDTIVRAHYDTCDYTVEKIKPFVERAHTNPKLTQCTGQRCPLKGSPEMSFLDEFSDRFMDHVRQVCTFAKLIPGFKCLQHDDQVTLLKSCVFEVLTVRLSGLFDNQSLVCMNGDVIRRETISAMPAGNAKFLMDNVFELTQRINRFNLSDAEIGLFCAVVIISADRPGLRNPELVGRMQNKLKNILQSILVPQHPHHSAIFTELCAICQDLRTLNTLHTEKFLLQAKVMRDEVGGSLTVSASSSPLPPSSVASTAHHSIVGQSYVDREWEENTNSLDRDSTGSRSPQSSSDSPATSHSFSMEDLRRSPLGSVSSSESIANSETFSKLSVNDLKIHGSVLLNALTSPALSQQLGAAVAVSQSHMSMARRGGLSVSAANAQQQQHHIHHHHHTNHQSSRKRELSHSENGSSRSHQAGSEDRSSMSVGTPSIGGQQETKCPYKARKLDSPSDSGIDSPKAQGSHSTNTSVCSSPRSSMEENQASDEADSRPDLEEQHPLLKRALQQPPQPFNMGGVSNFQDEVYKPHKKFRHSGRKDGDEPTSSTQDTPQQGGQSPGSSLVHTHSILASQLAAPPTYQRRSSPPPSGGGGISSALAGNLHSNVSSSQQAGTSSSGVTTVSRSGTYHHTSLLATTLSRPVAVARAKRDEERSELLANLILDSGRYRPLASSSSSSSHNLHHYQKSQSLLMCATTTMSPVAPLPAHTASELSALSCGQPVVGRHLPVPVAPSHSTSTSGTSLSSPRGVQAAAAGAQKKLRDPTTGIGFSCSDAEDSMPLNLCVKSAASPSSASAESQDQLCDTGAAGVKQEPLGSVEAE